MELGYDVVSTGGSASALAKAGLPVQKVEDVTGFPEMLDGMWLLGDAINACEGKGRGPRREAWACPWTLGVRCSAPDLHAIPMDPAATRCAGRVKTLHPMVHGGILARREVAEHMAALDKHGIGTIDVVVVNLYPFRQTVTAEQKPPYEVRGGGGGRGERGGARDMLLGWDGRELGGWCPCCTRHASRQGTRGGG